jgi:hypothetical protein
MPLSLARCATATTWIARVFAANTSLSTSHDRNPCRGIARDRRLTRNPAARARCLKSPRCRPRQLDHRVELNRAMSHVYTIVCYSYVVALRRTQCSDFAARLIAPVRHAVARSTRGQLSAGVLPSVARVASHQSDGRSARRCALRAASHGCLRARETRTGDRDERERLARDVRPRVRLTFHCRREVRGAGGLSRPKRRSTALAKSRDPVNQIDSLQLGEPLRREHASDFQNCELADACTGTARAISESPGLCHSHCHRTGGRNDDCALKAGVDEPRVAGVTCRAER